MHKMIIAVLTVAIIIFAIKILDIQSDIETALNSADASLSQAESSYQQMSKKKLVVIKLTDEVKRIQQEVEMLNAKLMHCNQGSNRQHSVLTNHTQ